MIQANKPKLYLKGFDALGWRTNEKTLYLFQFKSNLRPSKKIMEEYKKINKKYYVKCVWINKPDRKDVEMFEVGGRK